MEVNDMTNVPENTMKTGEIALKLGVETVTIRKYCLALENNGYTFLRNDGKNRDFTGKDLESLAQMKHLIEVAKMARETAAKVVVAGQIPVVDMEKEPPSNSVSFVKASQINDSSENERYFEQQNDLMRNVENVAEMVIAVKEITEGLQQQVATLTEENQSLKTQSRDAYITDFITVRRVENKLSQEAERLWEQQSEAKRFIKRWYNSVGIGKPIENIHEKDKFIKRFIDEHLEEALKPGKNK